VDADVDEPLAVPAAAVPPVDTTVTGNATVNIQRQQQKTTFHLDWKNNKNGKIILLPEDYQFPKLTFENLICFWYCGDVSRNIPPYQMLAKEHLDALKVKLKGGSQLLSMMRSLIKQVERAAKDIANRPVLVISGGNENIA